MISQFDVELFTEVAGVCPEQGGVLILLPVALAVSSDTGRTQEMTERFLGCLLFPKVRSKSSWRSIVEPSDDLFILLEKWILS